MGDLLNLLFLFQPYIAEATHLALVQHSKPQILRVAHQENQATDNSQAGNNTSRKVSPLAACIGRVVSIGDQEINYVLPHTLSEDATIHL